MSGKRHMMSPELLMPEVVAAVDRAEEAGQPESPSKLNYSVSAERPAGQAAVESAIAVWNESLGERAFSPTDDNPNVEIVICDGLRAEGGLIAGQTSWTVGSDGKLNAMVKLNSVGPDGRSLSSSVIRNEALHELGHVLGLDDNCRGGHAMSSLNIRRPLRAPANDEIQAVRDLRDFERELAMAQSSRSER